MPETRSWAITTECLWCSQPFVQIEIDHTLAWLCTTEACRERQLAFKITTSLGTCFSVHSRSRWNSPKPSPHRSSARSASAVIARARSPSPFAWNLSRGTPAERIHGVISAPRVEPDRREPNALC